MIDSHSHIYTKPYRDDRDAVLNRAREAGISQLLQVGCNLEESRLAVDLAEHTKGVYASVGIHPHDASTWTKDTAAVLSDLTRKQKVIAYGEIGLDYYYDHSPREVQRTAFREQMGLVETLDLPIVIHTREAEPDTLDILGSFSNISRGHVHCYTGTLSTAQSILEMGFHIGFTGVITFKKSELLREVVKYTPMDRLLIETDSPYLAPVPHRGKRNEPAFVLHVAEAVAAIKGLSTEEVIRQTCDNFYQVYGQPGFEWETL